MLWVQLPTYSKSYFRETQRPPSCSFADVDWASFPKRKEGSENQQNSKSTLFRKLSRLAFLIADYQGKGKGVVGFIFFLFRSYWCEGLVGGT